MAEILSTGVELKVAKTPAVPPAVPSYTKILQITSIDGPGGTTDSLEKTDYDSAVKEFRAGLHDPGEASFEFNLDPNDDEHVWLVERPASRQTYPWRIEIPTAPKKTYIEFDGFVTAAPPSFGEPGEIITASTSIKITGPIVWSKEP